MSEYARIDLLEIEINVCIICLIFSFSIYIINLFHNKLLFMIIGSLFLVIISVQMGINHNIVNDGKNIRVKFIE